ncbi:MAG: hypothetical protein ACI4QL_02230, partial [Candidatus Fimimonas sp.]
MIVEKNLQLRDERKPSDAIFNDGVVSVCYTLKTDDVTKGEKPWGTPFVDRTGDFSCDGGYFDAQTQTRLTVENYGKGLVFSAQTQSDDLSEWGLNFPFNFMGKLNGGGFENQFLLNSPYVTPERDVMSFYLTKPNGNNLLLAVSGAAGWKMDYSTYAGGHFLLNLKIFGSFDKAYSFEKSTKQLQVFLLPVTDYFCALKQLATIFDRPFIYPVLSCGKIGEKTQILKFGNVDEIVEERDGKIFRVNDEYEFSREGESTLTPYCNGKKGAGVTVFGYSTLVDLYKKSMDSVDLSVVAQTDGNLCEHQCWCSAMLRFLLNYKNRLSAAEVENYENKILSLLNVVTEKDPQKAVARRTIL